MIDVLVFSFTGDGALIEALNPLWLISLWLYWTGSWCDYELRGLYCKRGLTLSKTSLCN